MRLRKKTRQIKVGGVPIGGDAPIAVQSMTKVHPRDVTETLRQIKEAAAEGCEIMRIAIPDREAAEALEEIRPQSPIPIVADLHFKPQLAFLAIEKGADAIRVNPGTMPEGVLKDIFGAAKEKGIAVRIGINAGSLPRRYRKGRPSEAMVYCAMEYVELAQSLGLDQIKVSLKASDVMETVEAYRRFSQLSDVPLHLGVTEAGPPFSGSIKSAVGLGILLYEGIGDTIRVSLTGPSVLEVRAAYHILRALGIRSRGVEIISCPTCGRCEVDLFPIVRELEDKVAQFPYCLKVAVMGCPVNGPGEAKEADVGIAAGKTMGVLFRKGKVIASVPPDKWVERLLEEIRAFAPSGPSTCNGSSGRP